MKILPNNAEHNLRVTHITGSDRLHPVPSPPAWNHARATFQELAARTALGIDEAPSASGGWGKIIGEVSFKLVVIYIYMWQCVCCVMCVNRYANILYIQDLYSLLIQFTCTRDTWQEKSNEQSNLSSVKTYCVQWGLIKLLYGCSSDNLLLLSSQHILYVHSLCKHNLAMTPWHLPIVRRGPTHPALCRLCQFLLKEPLPPSSGCHPDVDGSQTPVGLPSWNV